MRSNRVMGLYFLFTLGFLLIFSGGFLTYLAWQGPGYQGSLAALEAPITPPTLPKSGPDASHQKAGEKTRPAATLESTEPETPPQVAPPEPAPEPITMKEALPQTKNQKLPAVNASKTTTQPAKTTAADVHGATTGQSVAAAHEIPKAESKKTQKKARKESRTSNGAVDETQIPPEWNWFSVPMRFEGKDGKIQIVTDPGDNVQPGEASVPETAASDAAVRPEKATETASIGVSLTAPEDTSAYKQRLTNILARLQNRRELRAREAEKRALVLPSSNVGATDTQSHKTGASDIAGPSESETLKTINSDADRLPPMPQEQTNDGSVE